MRIGILGGSFDPPHAGHLLVAQDALDELALDRLLVVPAAQQPLKGPGQTPAAHRLAMVQACRRWPSAVLHLLVGDDVVSTLPRWRDVTRLLSMVQLVVLHRADRGHDEAALTDTLASVGASTARRLATRRVDLSSTEIRARVRDGRSIRGCVPDAVATYIATTGLYLENSRELSTAEDPARA